MGEKPGSIPVRLSIERYSLTVDIAAFSHQTFNDEHNHRLWTLQNATRNRINIFFTVPRDCIMSGNALFAFHT